MINGNPSEVCSALMSDDMTFADGKMRMETQGALAPLQLLQHFANDSHAGLGLVYIRLRTEKGEVRIRKQEAESGKRIFQVVTPSDRTVDMAEVVMTGVGLDATATTPAQAAWMFRSFLGPQFLAERFAIHLLSDSLTIAFTRTPQGLIQVSQIPSGRR